MRTTGGVMIRRHRRACPRNSRPAGRQRPAGRPHHRRNPGAGARRPHQRLQGARAQVSGQRGGAHHRLRCPHVIHRDAQTHRIGVALPADRAGPAPRRARRIVWCSTTPATTSTCSPPKWGAQTPRRYRAGAGALPACGFANTFWGKTDEDGKVIEHYYRRCQGLFEDDEGNREECDYRFRAVSAPPAAAKTTSQRAAARAAISCWWTLTTSSKRRSISRTAWSFAAPG